MITQTLIIDCWEVTRPDGAGFGSDHIAYAKSQEIGMQIAAELGCNWPSNVRKFDAVHTYNICATLEDYRELSNIVKREKVLAKLSKEDKKILGLI